MQIKEEPRFFVNDFLAESEKDIKDILNVIKQRPMGYEDRAFFLKGFMNNIFRAYMKKRKSWIIEEEIKEAEREEIILEKSIKKRVVNIEKARDKEALKKELEEKRNEILKKLGVAVKPVLVEQKHAVIPVPLPHGIKADAKLEAPKPEEELKKEGGFDGNNYKVNSFEGDFGKISMLVNDPKISEIVCDEAGKPVHIVYNGRQDVPTNVQFGTAEELNKFIAFLAQKFGKQADSENPLFTAENGIFTVQATVQTEHSKARFVLERK